MACSQTCVQNYMQRYGTYCTKGRTPTCQDYARIHNGGPNGCNNPNTLSYWRKVQAIYGELYRRDQVGAESVSLADESKNAARSEFGEYERAYIEEEPNSPSKLSDASEPEGVSERS